MDPVMTGDENSLFQKIPKKEAVENRIFPIIIPEGINCFKTEGNHIIFTDNSEIETINTENFQSILKDAGVAECLESNFNMIIKKYGTNTYKPDNPGQKEVIEIIMEDKKK
jgi:hypothetical protein